MCQIDTVNTQYTHLCHLLHMSKFTRFGGNQTDPKSAGGGPNSILKTVVHLSVQDSNCNGWYLVVLSQYEAVIDVIGSVEGIDAFIY